jgi:hypothetical protein
MFYPCYFFYFYKIIISNTTQKTTPKALFLFYYLAGMVSGAMFNPSKLTSSSPGKLITSLLKVWSGVVGNVVGETTLFLSTQIIIIAITAMRATIINKFFFFIVLLFIC